MSRTAFARSNILTPQERLDAGRKCLSIIEDNGIEELEFSEKKFVEQMQENMERYGVSERQLAWLRDIVERSI